MIKWYGTCTIKNGTVCCRIIKPIFRKWSVKIYIKVTFKLVMCHNQPGILYKFTKYMYVHGSTVSKMGFGDDVDSAFVLG